MAHRAKAAPEPRPASTAPRRIGGPPRGQVRAARPAVAISPPIQVTAEILSPNSSAPQTRANGRPLCCMAVPRAKDERCIATSKAAVAREVLGADPRVTFVIADGLDHVRTQSPGSLDLIFADAWPGKYEGLDETLALLAPGGLYVVDDMSRQPNWPQGHQPRVDVLAARLKSHPDLVTVALGWASGLVIAARRS